MDIYLGFALKLVVGMAILIAVIRLMGNKEMSELTPLDMIFIVIFSDLVAGVAHSTDLDWKHMIFALLFWAVLIWSMEKITYKFPKADKAVQGEPKIIIRNGIPIKKVMEDEKMTLKELNTLLRHEGIWDIREVEIGVLEISGKINCKRFDKGV